jgi:hypothetical protein
LDPDIRWCWQHQAYSLAEKLLEGKRRASLLYPKRLPISNEQKIGLAFLYSAQEQWAKALQIYESYPNQPFRMGGNGPWGDVYTIIYPAALANECRESLALPPKENIPIFKPEPLIGFGGRGGAFDTDDTGLWVGVYGRLWNLTFDLTTNLLVSLPMDRQTPITSICVSPAAVWVATGGEGLFECDRATGKIQKYTTRDGMLSDHIACLRLAGGRLWLGYGNDTGYHLEHARSSAGRTLGGGLGHYDIPKREFTSFALSLTNNPDAHRNPFGNGVTEPLNQPPHRQVTDVACGPVGDPWFLALDHPLRHFRPAQQTWEGLDKIKECGCLAADSDHLYVGRCGAMASGIGFPTSGDQLGVSVLNFKDGQWRELKGGPEVFGGTVTALAVDRARLWVGGQGYVACFDLNQDKLITCGYLTADKLHKFAIQHIATGGGYVWIQHECAIYRARIPDLP